MLGLIILMMRKSDISRLSEFGLPHPVSWHDIILNILVPTLNVKYRYVEKIGKFKNFVPHGTIKPYELKP